VFSHQIQPRRNGEPAAAAARHQHRRPFSYLNKDQPADPVGHVAFAVDQGYGIAPAQVHIESMTSASAFDANARRRR